MQEWYVEQPQPTLNGGNEQDEWDDYVIDSFNEALYTTELGETVTLCSGLYNGETGEFEIEYTTKAIIQDKTPDSYTKGWVRQILVEMSDDLTSYKYVKYKNKADKVEELYLIATMPTSNGIYTKAVIHECNYTLKWQDGLGNIYYYPSYTADATQYNTGVENAYNVVQTGYLQYMSYVSLDEITAELHRDKRMFLDYATIKPDTYVITSTSKIPFSYNQMRMMRITFTECEYNSLSDRIDLMLCDYIEPKPIVSKNIQYKGKPEIRIGAKKTFTSTNIERWSVNSSMFSDKIHITPNGDECLVEIDVEPSMVGMNFKLIAKPKELYKNTLSFFL